ncbi:MULTISPECIES: DUF1906 domain-containing protein [Actinomadura]|uniref:DUF1906 domain-containing protein n=1 Tax=Actinomadura yumaensis TaxID=111807 RepID=A0ABW2CI52_9ACTN|nr:DUF1906 domain-containing protein [Actinomadura sp. J1-007]MWK33081.1 DUF1906 domain-containing protein [Actinomadura sp. J1-007]
MRHAVPLIGLLAAAAPVVAGAGPAAARPPADPPAPLTARTGAGARPGSVAYRGVRVPVPEGWEVVRLDREPSRCARFDRHAIYLGRQGDGAGCPARAVGRTEAVHVEPLDGPPARRTGAVRAGRLARHSVPVTDGREDVVPLPEAGVTITGAYGTDRAALERVLRGTRLRARWTAEPVPPRGDEPVPPKAGAPAPRSEVRAKTRTWVRAKGFDTCTAPSLKAMAAWRRAYGVANIYIGGASRGCAQPNLTRAWVRAVRGMGYRLIPTYVGLQAPCSRYKTRFTAQNASAQGARAAADAVRDARALGIPRRKPIYFDIEAYRSRDTECRRAVMRFLHSWTRKLKAKRYVPGVYSSVTSGIRDLGAARGTARPTAVWYAHWDGVPTVYGDRYLPDRWWPPHRRIKQYRGGHRERHGGVTINVDSNTVDGRVY